MCFAFSWEVWVESIAVLGVAVHHLMRNRSPSLHVCLHCDTDQATHLPTHPSMRVVAQPVVVQEYTDHAARMAFIGPEATIDLVKPCLCPPALSAHPHCIRRRTI